MLSESRIAVSSATLRPRIGIPDRLRRAPLYIGTMMAASAIGVVIAGQNALYAVRLIVGVCVMAALWRYPYALLLCWVLIGTLVGTSVPIFNGNNIDTALTVPALLILPFMPIKDTFKRLPALALFLAYLLWQLLGFNISPLDHVTFLKQWALSLDQLVVAVLTINLLSTRRRLSRFIGIVLVAPTAIALYGIYGYFTHQNLQYDSAGGRITSVFTNGPVLALLLSTVLPLALYRIVTARNAGRLIAFLVFCILLLATILTFARGALIGVALCLVMAIPLLPSRAMKRGMLGGVLGLAALIALLVTVGNVPVFARFFASDLATLNNRTLLWNAVLDHFDPTQLRGNGLGAVDTLLGNLFGRYWNGPTGDTLLEAHNLYLSVLYNFGIIGLTLLTLTFVALAVSLIAGLRKATGDRRTLFVISLLTFVSVLVQQLDTADLVNQTFGVYFFVVMALPFALCWSGTGEPAEPAGVPLDRAPPPRTVAGNPSRGGPPAPVQVLTQTPQHGRRQHRGR